MAESISWVEPRDCMCLLMGERRRDEGVLRAREKGLGKKSTQKLKVVAWLHKNIHMSKHCVMT